MSRSRAGRSGHVHHQGFASGKEIFYKLFYLTNRAWMNYYGLKYWNVEPNHWASRKKCAFPSLQPSNMLLIPAANANGQPTELTRFNVTVKNFNSTDTNGISINQLHLIRSCIIYTASCVIIYFRSNTSDNTWRFYSSCPKNI